MHFLITYYILLLPELSSCVCRLCLFLLEMQCDRVLRASRLTSAFGVSSWQLEISQGRRLSSIEIGKRCNHGSSSPWNLLSDICQHTAFLIPFVL